MRGGGIGIVPLVADDHSESPKFLLDTCVQFGVIDLTHVLSLGCVVHNAVSLSRSGYPTPPSPARESGRTTRSCDRAPASSFQSSRAAAASRCAPPSDR